MGGELTPLTEAIWVHTGRPCHPHTGLGSSWPRAKAAPGTGRGTKRSIVKVLTWLSFLSSLLPWPCESPPNSGEQNVLGCRPGHHKLLLTDSRSKKQNNRRPGPFFLLLSSPPLFPARPRRERNASFGHSQERNLLLRGSLLPINLVLHGHKSWAPRSLNRVCLCFPRFLPVSNLDLS